MGTELYMFMRAKTRTNALTNTHVRLRRQLPVLARLLLSKGARSRIRVAGLRYAKEPYFSGKRAPLLQ